MARIEFEGNLGGDPEISYTPNGRAVAKFTVAETERIKDPQTGEWADGDTTWWRCTAWQNVAEQAGEHLVKGTGVIVRGRVKIREYDKDGQRQWATEVTADSIGLDVRRIKPKGESSSSYQGSPPF